MIGFIDERSYHLPWYGANFNEKFQPKHRFVRFVFDHTEFRDEFVVRAFISASVMPPEPGKLYAITCRAKTLDKSTGCRKSIAILAG